MLFSPDSPDLLPRIPLSARTVLFAGCGGGRLAAAYRPMNPAATLLGIDADPAATSRAGPHFDQIATADLEAGKLPFDVPGGIDCIVYDEVLEYLRDPWAVLQRHAESLNAEGMMLICVANTNYWRHAERILRGIPAANETPGPGATQPAGPPPIRLFNPDTVRDNLLRIGLTLCDVTLREPDPLAASRFAAALAAGLEALDIDPRDYAMRAAASHTIWRVRRQPRRRLLLAANMLPPIGGVSHVRVLYPLEAVRTDPMIIATVTDRIEITPADFDTPRMFILHRPALAGEHGHATLRQLATAGFLIITEFDDLPDHRFKAMRLGGALSFYGTHAIQTSTAALAEALRKYNPEIAIFPNAVGALPEVTNFADPASMTLFFGALNREQDWLPLMPIINEVAALAGDRLRFQIVHDRGFFDALDTPHKAFTPTCDYATYLRILGNSEISFMPLSDTPFNRAKSDLKFIEAASCRVASLSSSVVYGNSIEHGRTGLLFRDPVEFHRCLLQLLALPEHAQALGDAARETIRQDRMMAYQVAPRIAWYRSLWARRDALNAARAERMHHFQAAA